MGIFMGVGVFVRVLGAAIVVTCVTAARPFLRYVDSPANHARTDAFRPGHGTREYTFQKIAVVAFLALLGVVGVILLAVGPS